MTVTEGFWLVLHNEAGEVLVPMAKVVAIESMMQHDPLCPMKTMVTTSTGHSLWVKDSVEDIKELLVKPCA